MSVWNGEGKHIEVHLGTTAANGQVSFTYHSQFSGSNAVIPAIIGGAAGRMIRVISQSASGCTVQVDARNSVDILGISVLSSTATPVSGQAVSVTVVER